MQGWQVGKKVFFRLFLRPLCLFSRGCFHIIAKIVFFSDLQKSTFIFSDQLSFCFDMVEVQCNHHLQALLASHLSFSLLKFGKYAKRTSTWFPKLFNLILVLILSFFSSIKFPKLLVLQYSRKNICFVWNLWWQGKRKKDGSTEWCGFPGYPPG